MTKEKLHAAIIVMFVVGFVAGLASDSWMVVLGAQAAGLLYMKIEDEISYRIYCRRTGLKP